MQKSKTLYLNNPESTTYPRMLCAKISCKWLSDSEEEDLYVFSVFPRISEKKKQF